MSSGGAKRHKATRKHKTRGLKVRDELADDPRFKRIAKAVEGMNQSTRRRFNKFMKTAEQISPKLTESAVTGKLRQHILASGQSLYSIAKAIDYDLSGLMKFMRGQSSLSAAVIDKLAERLGLVLIKRE